jgi:hypothetical protein
MTRQTQGKGRNIPKTSHPKKLIPFHVQRSSSLYKACSAAIGVSTTLKNDILAIALTNHLVQMTLHWSSSSGGYKPSRAFKIQEKYVFENILSHNNIPSSIEKPILLVRQHLQVIYNSSMAILPCVINIFKHIEEEWNRVPLQEFKDWIIFYEIGTKAAALLFHAAFNKSLTLPVDSHVWHAFRNWGWTNAKSTDKCSWQASTWMDLSYFIKTNDAIGSIRQTLANKSKNTGYFDLPKKNYNLTV